MFCKSHATSQAQSLTLVLPNTFASAQCLYICNDQLLYIQVLWIVWANIMNLKPRRNLAHSTFVNKRFRITKPHHFYIFINKKCMWGVITVWDWIVIFFTDHLFVQLYKCINPMIMQQWRLLSPLLCDNASLETQ